MRSTFAFTEGFELHHDTNSGRADCGPTLQLHRCKDGASSVGQDALRFG